MIWNAEEEAKWTIVSRSHQKKSFAQVLIDAPRSRSAFSRFCFTPEYDPRGCSATEDPTLEPVTTSSTIRKLVFHRLHYPANYFISNFSNDSKVWPMRRVLCWVPKLAWDQREPPQFKLDLWAADLGPCSRCLAPGHGKSNCRS